MPTITAEALAKRIDSALAVDRALNVAERTAFLENRLVGQYDGAQPADWISEANDADAFLGRVEPWLKMHSATATAALVASRELPERLASALYVSALYACIATGTVKPDGPDRTNAVYDLANRAALWARGYADALGWYPEHEQ